MLTMRTGRPTDGAASAAGGAAALPLLPVAGLSVPTAGNTPLAKAVTPIAAPVMNVRLLMFLYPLNELVSYTSIPTRTGGAHKDSCTLFAGMAQEFQHSSTE